MQTSTKILNIALGFFGWLILGTLVSILIGLVYLTPKVSIIISIIIWLSTIFVSLLLGFKKRFWIMSGVIAASVTNGILMYILLSRSIGDGRFSILGVILMSGMPIPALIFLILAYGFG